MKKLDKALVLIGSLPIFIVLIVLFPVVYLRKRLKLREHVDIYFKYK